MRLHWRWRWFFPVEIGLICPFCLCPWSLLTGFLLQHSHMWCDTNISLEHLVLGRGLVMVYHISNNSHAGPLLDLIGNLKRLVKSKKACEYWKDSWYRIFFTLIVQSSKLKYLFYNWVSFAKHFAYKHFSFAFLGFPPNDITYPLT